MKAIACFFAQRSSSLELESSSVPGDCPTAASAPFPEKVLFDFVCFQELWLESNRKMVEQTCKETLPYSKHFQGGVIGTGLFVLSRWPILESKFHKFRVNGLKHKFWHGDGLAGKGVGMILVELANGQLAAVYTTHFHATYNRKTFPYKADQCAQAIETLDFIEQTSKAVNADVVVLAGDLNSQPGEIPYKLIKRLGHFRDGLDEGHPLPFTFCCTANSFLLKGRDEMTLDYILHKTTKNHLKSSTVYTWKPMENRIQGFDFSFSDHDSIASEIKIENSDCDKVETDDLVKVIEEAQNVLANEITRSSTDWIFETTLFLNIFYFIYRFGIDIATLLTLTIFILLFTFHKINCKERINDVKQDLELLIAMKNKLDRD